MYVHAVTIYSFRSSMFIFNYPLGITVIIELMIHLFTTVLHLCRYRFRHDKHTHAYIYICVYVSMAAYVCACMMLWHGGHCGLRIWHMWGSTIFGSRWIITSEIFRSLVWHIFLVWTIFFDEMVLHICHPSVVQPYACNLGVTRVNLVISVTPQGCSSNVCSHKSV